MTRVATLANNLHPYLSTNGTEPTAKANPRPPALPRPRVAPAGISAMSVGTTSTESYECRRCGGPREPGTAFCSDVCQYRQRGEKILNQLESDADTCATCFRPTRHGPVDLDAFHQTCRDRIAGRAHGPACGSCWLAWHRHRQLYESGTGVKTVRAEATSQAHRPVYRYEWGCVCGTTDPNEAHRFLQTGGKFVAARRDALFRALERLSAKGAIDGTPERDALDAAYQERPTDWKYQAGKAVYGSAD